MRTNLLFLSILFLTVFSSAQGQTTISVDYNQTGSPKKTTLDFTSKAVIKIIHIPSHLGAPIALSDGGSTNISIAADQLKSYGAAFSGNTLTIQFDGGKIISPFTTDNLQAFYFSFNNKQFVINPLQPDVDTGNKSSVSSGAATKAKPSLKQIPVQDAVTLAASIPNKDTTYKKIIGYYCFTLHGKVMPATPGSVDRAGFIKIFDSVDNPFLKDNSVYDLLFFGTSTTGIEGGSLLGSLGKSVGGLDVTTIADGFAQFLVNRTKAELGTAFFDRFRTVLQDTAFWDARILFPNTFNTLNAIGNQIYQYNAYLAGLRAAFIKDLNALPQNLPNVITDGRHKDFFEKHPYLQFTCLEGFDIANGLIQGEHIGQIIEELPPSYFANLSQNTTPGYDPNALKNLSGILQSFQLFSTSLKSAKPDQYWIGIDTLKLLTNNATLRVYLGLLYEELKQNDIVFGNGKTLKTLLTDVASNYTAYVIDYLNFFKGLVQKAILIETDIRETNTKKADSIAFENYYRYFNETLDLISYAGKLGDLKGLSAIKPDSSFQRYINISRTISDLVLDINRKNYASAVLDACTVYNFGFGNTQAFSPQLLKWGTFMATVAQAKTADEVSQAIEAAALPQGSSRVKRESKFNVALNAYVGLYGGYEKYTGDHSNWLFPKINAFGVTAPVGVSVSLGKRHLFNPFCGTGHSSFSLFVSLIDLGALASFRFGDSTSTAPKIQLKDIVSPGAFLSIGIPKTPLSVNLGLQLGPNLRSITHSDGTVTANDDTKAYLRTSFSLLVDIPVINFYTDGGN